jgi:hypothetical protein
MYSVTKVLAMDCEMVGAGSDGKRSILARVSLVNKSLYACLYVLKRNMCLLFLSYSKLDICLFHR